MSTTWFIVGIVAALGLVAVLLVVRHRRRLKAQQDLLAWRQSHRGCSGDLID